MSVAIVSLKSAVVTLWGLDAVVRLLSDTKAGGLRQTLGKKESNKDANGRKTLCDALINAMQSM